MTLVVSHILGWFSSSLSTPIRPIRPSIAKIGLGILYLASFFDGAAQGGRCRCVFWIVTSLEQEYWVHWGAGRGTNMKAEAMALWGLLWFVSFLCIPSIHIYGDSQSIINHVRGITNIRQPHLQGWLKQIMNLWKTFRHISIQCIGREYNHNADKMSKMGLWALLDGMHIEIWIGGTTLDAGVFPFPG